MPKSCTNLSCTEFDEAQRWRVTTTPSRGCLAPQLVGWRTRRRLGLWEVLGGLGWFAGWTMLDCRTGGATWLRVHCSAGMQTDSAAGLPAELLYPGGPTAPRLATRFYAMLRDARRCQAMPGVVHHRKTGWCRYQKILGPHHRGIGTIVAIGCRRLHSAQGVGTACGLAGGWVGCYQEGRGGAAGRGWELGVHPFCSADQR